MKNKETVKGKIEGILFAMGESVQVKDIAEALELEEKQVRKVIAEMQEDYKASSRGISIVELEDGVQLRTKDDYYEDLIKIAAVPKKNVLSDSSLEILSIIAYKQPVTRLDIEKIRGVNSDYGLNKLLEFGLVKELGKLDAPGHPLLFGTTEQFLRSFGVKSIEELPEMNQDVLADFKAQAEQEIQYKLDI